MRSCLCCRTSRARDAVRQCPSGPAVLSLIRSVPRGRFAVDQERAGPAFPSRYNSPTLALLYTPTFTWSGRYRAARDTYALEIRTVDPAATGSSYPLLTSVTACPQTACTSSLARRRSAASWSSRPRASCTSISPAASPRRASTAGGITRPSSLGWLGRTPQAQPRRVQGIFVTERDMLLVLQKGDVTRSIRDGRPGRRRDQSRRTVEFGPATVEYRHRWRDGHIRRLRRGRFAPGQGQRPQGDDQGGAVRDQAVRHGSRLRRG